jgi:hypothetical protein
MLAVTLIFVNLGLYVPPNAFQRGVLAIKIVLLSQGLGLTRVGNTGSLIGNMVTIDLGITISVK